MAESSHALSALTNPLVTPSQLLQHLDSSSYPTDAHSTLYAVCRLTSSAGILCRLPQETIARAIVLLQRFLTCGPPLSASASTSSSLSLTIYSAGALYTTAKVSATPLAPRSIVNVYAYLTSPASPLRFLNPDAHPARPENLNPDSNPAGQDHPNLNPNPNPNPNGNGNGNRKGNDNADPRTYFVSEGTYERERTRLFLAEATILSTLAYDTHVALPHALALTYLSVLGVHASPHLARRVLSHLNAALLSPALLYLTHQPPELAVAAIYLAAHDEGVKLVQCNWWEVFDVPREDLGFLVLAMGSLVGFARAQVEMWEGSGKVVPLG